MIQYLLNTVSNVLLFLSAALLIDGFGISKLADDKRCILAAAVTAVMSGGTFLLYKFDLNPLPFFTYPLTFAAAFLISFKRLSIAQLYVFIIMELSATLLSSCAAAIVFRSGLMTYETADIIAQIFIRTAFLIASAVLRRRQTARYVYSVCKNIPKHIFVLVLLALALMDSLSICNNYPGDNVLKQGIITVLVALLTVTQMVMIFSLLMNVAAKNYFNDLNHLLEKQVSAQISHYEKMEKLNNDMRTFRHDYVNHLGSILALIDGGCTEDAKEYIEKLTNSARSSSTEFHTGNRLADAILADKSYSCKDFADIEFDGCISDKIDNADMCIILANALDNAVEACRKCTGRSVIRINASLRQGYWTMTMKNPTSVSADYEGIPQTSKEDTLNHGLGLHSIERTVKKYDGTMKVKNENMVFELSMALKI